MHKQTADLLEQHFDTAFAAPDGIKKLRELILTLAMQGKLVKQDPNDPPASALLQEIEAEKERLVKSGKIKIPKPLPPIKPEEIPYELPRGWEWVRLGEITEYNGRKNISGDEIAPNTWLLDLEDIEKGTSRILFRVKFLERQSKSTKSTFQKGDVLYGKLRPYLDKVVVADVDGVCTTEIVPIVPFNGIHSEFLRWLLKRPAFLAYVNSLMYGVKMPRLGTDDAVTSLHPLPPLPEQHRIVSRIDELMARCDALEKLRKEREEKRLAVHAAAVKQLLEAKDGSAWGFIEQHFGELYAVKENVAELCKAILQLAVMGRLVPQSPNDPPAKELLKEIDAEKQRLVKAGKIKTPKPLPPIKPEEMPYELPLGWEWVYLQDVFGFVTDGDHQAPPKSDCGIPFLVIGNLNSGKISFDGCRYVPQDYYEALDWGRKPAKNDILYTVTGSYGIPIQIIGEERFCVQRHVAILKSLKHTPFQYICYLLRSAYALNYATTIATGIAQKTVPLMGLRRMLIALPPLPEQHRIVARIDQLMALCDTLDQQIDAATSKQTELLDAIMAQV
ncbi:restriction endonuclease subunit S [Desulfobulbus elongatus]|uniref:restriction endonuclease subunit S n=1 Tax=Desulfobulbus elongatus TaxID=53332 RepID=UPI000482CB48|nr:restriction endonuclease subunit S [Desulfobulbus elongatus]